METKTEMNNALTYRERIAEIREQILTDIIELMNRNGLSEIKIDPEVDEPAHVIRFDKHEYPYYCRVFSVTVEKDNFRLHAVDIQDGAVNELDYRNDFSCRNVDLMVSLIENIDETICINLDRQQEKKESEGRL